MYEPPARTIAMGIAPRAPGRPLHHHSRQRRRAVHANNHIIFFIPHTAMEEIYSCLKSNAVAARKFENGIAGPQ